MIAVTICLISPAGDEYGRLLVDGAGITVSDSPDTTTGKATTRRVHQMIAHVRAALHREQFDTTLAPREFEQRVAEALLVAGMQGPAEGEIVISLPVTSLSPPASPPEETPSGETPPVTPTDAPTTSAWDDLFQISEPHPEAPLSPHPDAAAPDTFTDVPDQSEGESV